MSQNISATFTPEEAVAQAASLMAEYEKKLGELNEKEQQLFKTVIKKGEGRALDRIRTWIERIFSFKG